MVHPCSAGVGGEAARGETVQVLPGVEAPSICTFYDETLHEIPRRPADQVYQSWMHGDLNGANILLDDHSNVWLIDFFHARRGHVLQDLVKLENDLLYIFSGIEEHELPEALELSDRLLAVADLAAQPQASTVAEFRSPRRCCSSPPSPPPTMFPRRMCAIFRPSSSAG